MNELNGRGTVRGMKKSRPPFLPPKGSKPKPPSTPKKGKK